MSSPVHRWSGYVWVVDQKVPRVFAGADDGVVAVSDTVAELVGSQIFPDILHQTATFLVPSSVIDHQHGMCPGGDLSADFSQVRVHRFRVGSRHDDGGGDPRTGQMAPNR
jgi:hypothetical protein